MTFLEYERMRQREQLAGFLRLMKREGLDSQSQATRELARRISVKPAERAA